MDACCPASLGEAGGSISLVQTQVYWCGTMFGPCLNLMLCVMSCGVYGMSCGVYGMSCCAYGVSCGAYGMSCGVHGMSCVV